MRLYTIESATFLGVRSDSKIPLLDLASMTDFEAKEFDRIANMNVGETIAVDDSVRITRTE